MISNSTEYQVSKNTSLKFSTRRNKEINLTEYYDLSYEYKNDCLTAALRFNKTFYQDNDLVPTEDLFFSITLIPLTTYEREIYKGADQIKNKKLDYKLVTFFILPPSKEVLFERLSNRDMKDKLIAEERMKQFERDVLHWINYDYVVINDNIKNSFKNLLVHWVIKINT